LRSLYYVKNINWFGLVMVCSLLVLMSFCDDRAQKNQQTIREEMTSILPREVTSFKMYPALAYPEDFDAAVQLTLDTEVITAFFHAIRDQQPYLPQHDTAFAQWAIQIQTTAAAFTIGCYIPSDRHPHIVVGEIRSPSGVAIFQSRQLYQWYRKYRHRWSEPEASHPPEHTGNEDGDLP